MPLDSVAPSPQGDSAFLGTGWAFPPSFSRGGGDVEMVAGVDDVHESLRIILSTARGERVMQELFGCDLNGTLFAEVDQGLVNSLTRLVSDALLEHEPRVKLDRVEVDSSAGAEGLLRIAVQYTVRGTNSRFNMVYPFYLTEATTPGL